MSERPWTPGPWILHLDWKTEYDIPIGNDGEIACFVAGIKDHPRNLANARLIASAPELYEALAAIVDHETGGDFFSWGKKIDAAKIALEKALGRDVSPSSTEAKC